MQVIKISETHYTKTDGFYCLEVYIPIEQVLDYMTKLPKILVDNDYSRTCFLDNKIFTKYQQGECLTWFKDFIRPKNFRATLKRYIEKEKASNVK